MVDKDHCPDHSDTCERIAYLEARKTNGHQFVTYKWLIGTVGALAVVIVSTIFSLNSIAESKLDKKVDKALYVSLCEDVEKIKASSSRADKNLLLVMRHLKIEPER